MQKLFQRWLLLEAAIACLVVSAVAPPNAVAQDSSRAGLATNGLGGLHYGVPLKWSIALGYILPGSYRDWKPFAAVEPGIGGFRASLGALKITNELGGAYFARATVLHTTSKAWRAPAQATYVGPELQFAPIFAIGLRLGGFIRVGGNGDRHGLVTSDLSVMF